MPSGPVPRARCRLSLIVQLRPPPAAFFCPGTRRRRGVLSAGQAQQHSNSGRLRAAFFRRPKPEPFGSSSALLAGYRRPSIGSGNVKRGAAVPDRAGGRYGLCAELRGQRICSRPSIPWLHAIRPGLQRATPGRPAGRQDHHQSPNLRTRSEGGVLRRPDLTDRGSDRPWSPSRARLDKRRAQARGCPEISGGIGRQLRTAGRTAP